MRVGNWTRLISESSGSSGVGSSIVTVALTGVISGQLARKTLRPRPLSIIAYQQGNGVKDFRSGAFDISKGPFLERSGIEILYRR
jgi:hypothetical protein